MQIDYDVGDCVVCVEDSPGATIVVGSFYRVAEIKKGRWLNDDHGFHDLLVNVVGARPRLGSAGFHPFRFKKLPKASDEFTEQMRKIKPHKQKVDA